jgi:hypothetical protein
MAWRVWPELSNQSVSVSLKRQNLCVNSNNMRKKNPNSSLKKPLLYISEAFPAKKEILRIFFLTFASVLNRIKHKVGSFSLGWKKIHMVKVNMLSNVFL